MFATQRGVVGTMGTAIAVAPMIRQFFSLWLLKQSYNMYRVYAIVCPGMWYNGMEVPALPLHSSLKSVRW